MKFIKKPVVIEAVQWFQNGDHPGDHAPNEGGDLNRYNDYLFFTEGKVVRRYKTEDLNANRTCKHCAHPMHRHGWIDTLEGGHTVCPGDWIITGIKGERYPCKPDIFQATYEAVDNVTPYATMPPA